MHDAIQPSNLKRTHCRVCGKTFPIYYVGASGVCVDCAEGGQVRQTLDPAIRRQVRAAGGGVHGSHRSDNPKRRDASH